MIAQEEQNELPGLDADGGGDNSGEDDAGE
jgi:hypothetical protein